MKLRTGILDRTAVVAVVGQGYVGVTVAATAAEAGFSVVGIDVDSERIRGLAEGGCPVAGVDPALVAGARATGRLRFTTEAAAVETADVILIAVPTPLQNHTPDLRHIESACDEIASRLQPGRLVVLESTTYPGTTDEVVAPRLAKSGLRPGADFYVAYSPERIDPGNREWQFPNTPKVVGGLTPESGELATLFYAQLCEKVVTVSTCRTAELSKLLENTHRHVNIALVNEMAMVCHDMGIDVWEVIDATASKPFGYTPFFPGPGVGGHCIPVDPTYLTWKVRADAGREFRTIEVAENINAQMPAYVASRIADALNANGKAVRAARILVMGVSYKPNVGDVRESPSIQAMAHLHRRGAQLSFHDPYVANLTINGENFERSQPTSDALAEADCVALLTPHDAYDIDTILEHAQLVFDARNASSGRRSSNLVRL